MSTKLKELTWENHQNAERMVVARKLLKGMPAPEYHKFIYNQYVQYEALEVAARAAGMLEGIEGICRAPGMLADMEELEEEFGDARRTVIVESTTTIGIEDLIAQGQDTESRVLARAVKLHLEHRVLLNGNRTIVFK